MKRIKVPVRKIERIREDVYRLVFTSGALASRSVPGQFLHIYPSPVLTLRRPFSIHRVSGDDLHILFRLRGKGTAILSGRKKGDILDIIGPLGNGFTCKNAAAYDHIFFCAGGMGVAPLVFLAETISKKLNKKNKTAVSAILGAAGRKELLCADDFKRAGAKVITVTDDGSCGTKGTCTARLQKELRQARQNCIRVKVYACGPAAMFESLAPVIRSFPGIECEVSYEQFMGCGIGVCMGCVIETKRGYRRVCKDGPVFDLQDVS